MRTSIRQREACFRVEDGCLVRTVRGPADDPRAYTHRCALAVYQTVAWVLQELPRQGEGTTLAGIARHQNLPFTQVNVALEFLKERGLVDVRHRRCYPATPDVHLDAMIEFHALAEAQAAYAAANAHAVPADTTTPAKASRSKKSGGEATPKKVSGLDAAYVVLKAKGEPIGGGAIVEEVLAKGM